METADLKKKQSWDLLGAVRRLKWIFWPVFAAAEVLFVGIQLIYVATDAISMTRFVVNLAIFNVILFSLMFLVYAGFKRLLFRVYESESRMLTIEDISADAVFTQNMQFVITSWSQGARRIFGYTEDEAIGSSVAIILPDEVPEVDGHMAETLLEEGLIVQHRTVRRRKNGELFPAEVSVSLLRDPGGAPTGGISVLRDITRQVEMEDELRRANAELSGYAHVVSHDLKAPLATIKLAAHTLEVLTRMPSSEETEKQIEQVRGTLDHCVDQGASLIENLLALAEAGQLPDTLSPVRVSDVLAEVLEEMEGYISEAGAAVEVDDDLGVVMADPTHVHQVFANLISNAIRHNVSEEPRVEVRNRGCDDSCQRYLVRDNGAGVPEADIDRIFVPFFKGETGDTGIGLSTVQKIVGVYGGEIRAFNDGGACFEFTLKGANA